SYPRRGERLVEPDLVGRQRLHLHDLVRVVPARDVRDDRACLGPVARPVDAAARRPNRLLELQEVLVEARHDVGLDRTTCLAELLPVGHLGGDASTLVADRVGGVAKVPAQLFVRELAPSRSGEALRGRSHVAARISARWIERTGDFRRERPPPMWSRHEGSSAVQYSAPVASMSSHLSASIAVEFSAFLTAKVPPKPQHSRSRSSSTSSSPSTWRRRR